VGETRPVPFVTLFATAAVSAPMAGRLLDAFLEVRGNAASFIAGDGRVLGATADGELILLKVAGRPTVVSRLRIAPDDSGGYAHPALAGGRLFLRDRTHLLCLVLE
jgi:hypothetical protein